MKFLSKKIVYRLSGARIFLTSGVIFSTLFNTAFAQGPTSFATKPSIVPTGAPQSLEEVLNLLSTLTGWMFAFVLTIAVGAIIAGGIMYVTSAGSEKRSGTGIKMVIYALIGVVVAGMAWAMVNVVGSLIFDTSEPLIPTSGGGNRSGGGSIYECHSSGVDYTTENECIAKCPPPDVCVKK